MSQRYYIAIADKDADSLAHLCECLHRSGHDVVGQARSADQLARQCGGINLDLIITDVEMLGTSKAAASLAITENQDVPVIALSRCWDDLTLERSGACRVFAHLMKPVREQDLRAAIPLAVQRFAEFRTIRDESAEVQRALEDRKVIERAKGILMRRQSIDEGAAFRNLQQLARNQRMKMSDLAKSIVLAEKAMYGPTPIRLPKGESTAEQIA